MEAAAYFRAILVLGFMVLLFAGLLPAIAVRGAMSIRRPWLRSFTICLATGFATWMLWAVGLWVYVNQVRTRTALEMVEGNYWLHNLGIFPGLVIGVVVAAIIWRRRETPGPAS